MVQRFVNATIEGWYSYIYGDRTAANALIQKDNPEMSDEQLDLTLKETVKNLFHLRFQSATEPTLPRMRGFCAPTRSPARRSVSTPLMYFTSYPFASSHRTIGYSALNTKLWGSCARVSNGRL